MTVKVTLEIRFFCDDEDCFNEEVLFSGEPTAEPPPMLPPGWSHRHGEQYCPKHGAK